MKININQIPPEGLSLEENFPASGLDLELEGIKFRGPVKPLCNSECRGLCFKCGKNLNEGKCSCTV